MAGARVRLLGLCKCAALLQERTKRKWSRSIAKLVSTPKRRFGFAKCAPAPQQTAQTGRANRVPSITATLIRPLGLAKLARVLQGAPLAPPELANRD
jgi:hypothetical protein